jgi:hypothetical protein
MNARPTYDGIEPRPVGSFNVRGARESRRRAGWSPSTAILPSTFDAPSLVSDVAVAAIRKAFLLSKSSHEAWRSYKREGRIDPRHGPRADRGATDIFKRKTGVSTTRVKCAVLIDASGSMHGYGGSKITLPGQETKAPVDVTRSMAAAVFGATIAKALGRVPTVDLDIYQHAAGYGNRLYIKWRWHKGTPTGVFNEVAYGSIGGGGNADGHALFAIATHLKRDLKRGERGVIMVVSDGLPSIYAHGGKGDAGSALVDAVAAARKMGIEVIAVAIDGSDQACFYGKDGVVPFTGNWTALGSALAKHVGKALASK